MLVLKQNKIKSNESWIINYNLHNTLPCNVIAIVDFNFLRNIGNSKYSKVFDTFRLHQ